MSDSDHLLSCLIKLYSGGRPTPTTPNDLRLSVSSRSRRGAVEAVSFPHGSSLSEAISYSSFLPCSILRPVHPRFHPRCEQAPLLCPPSHELTNGARPLCSGASTRPLCFHGQPSASAPSLLCILFKPSPFSSLSAGHPTVRPSYLMPCFAVVRALGTATASLQCPTTYTHTHT